MLRPFRQFPRRQQDRRMRVLRHVPSISAQILRIVRVRNDYRKWHAGARWIWSQTVYGCLLGRTVKGPVRPEGPNFYRPIIVLAISQRLLAATANVEIVATENCSSSGLAGSVVSVPHMAKCRLPAAFLHAWIFVASTRGLIPRVPMPVNSGFVDLRG